MPSTSDDTMRERVTAERLLRSWSVRTSATRGGVSNETWGRYEAGGPLTLAMRSAIAQAFTWPADWPEHPPPLNSNATPVGPDTALLLDHVAEVNATVNGLEALGRLTDDRLLQVEALGRLIDE